MTISPERLRETSDRHPLFRGLSGQVIWLLFEERDIPVENIEAFMDHALAWREEQVGVLAELEDDPTKYLCVQVDDCENACGHCQGLHGAIMQANHPKLMEYLPPYSIGCRCRAQAITKEDISPDAQQLESLPKPERKLHCESEWFFAVEWKDRS